MARYNVLMMLSDVCLTSVCPTSVAYIRSAGGVCGRPAGWRVLADRARPGPARPAWLKAAAARFRCRPGRGHIVAAARLQLLIVVVVVNNFQMPISPCKTLFPLGASPADKLDVGMAGLPAGSANGAAAYPATDIGRDFWCCRLILKTNALARCYWTTLLHCPTCILHRIAGVRSMER